MSMVNIILGMPLAHDNIGTTNNTRNLSYFFDDAQCSKALILKIRSLDLVFSLTKYLGGWFIINLELQGCQTSAPSAADGYSKAYVNYTQL